MYRNLQKSEEFLKNIIENIPNMIFVKDADTLSFVRFNKAGEQLLGYSREELLGKTDYNFFPKEEADFFAAKDREALGSKTLVDIPEEKIITKANEERILHTKKIPILDENGAANFLLGISEDITERKTLEEQLNQAQKMESVGRLAGGVAHDFNNMLSVIIGHAELSMIQMDPVNPLFSALQEIRKAAEHSADLTQQLLAFARKQTITLKVIDLNVTVESILKMLRRLIGEDIDLAWLPGSTVWALKVDPSQIDQILANLCVNACDAIVGPGKVTIETANVTLDEAYCAEHLESELGDFVMLAVSDNGHGMDKETRDKIFEPFFTTKGIGRGTGLGLSTVYGIVKQNNGFINVYSEPGHGTTFRIYLPRHAAKTERIQKESPTVPVARGDETILLVEDEPAILKMAKLTLESWPPQRRGKPSKWPKSTQTRSICS
jgi:PAS domain S-box-containing protein